MDLALVNDEYAHAACTSSDIFEHIPTIREYAAQCVDVVEMGVRSGVSTWGFLRGLIDAAEKDPDTPRSLTGFDLSVAPLPYRQTSVTGIHGLSLRFFEENVLHAPPVACDLLFIDTFHVYGQLVRELALHAPGTRKFILMHDTTIDADNGEAIRCGWNAASMAASTGIPESEITVGLWPAIEEFLAAHPEWKLRQRFTNNNGLTVLERVSLPTDSA
jgi:hypothetical protein